MKPEFHLLSFVKAVSFLSEYLVLKEKPVIGVILNICLFLLQERINQINEANKIEVFNFLKQICKQVLKYMVIKLSLTKLTS